MDRQKIGYSSSCYWLVCNFRCAVSHRFLNFLSNDIRSVGDQDATFWIRIWLRHFLRWISKRFYSRTRIFGYQRLTQWKCFSESVVEIFSQRLSKLKMLELIFTDGNMSCSKINKFTLDRMRWMKNLTCTTWCRQLEAQDTSKVPREFPSSSRTFLYIAANAWDVPSL